MREYTIVGTRPARVGREARGKAVAIDLETLSTGCADAPAPVELLLAAVAGGVLGGLEHAAARLSFRVGAAVVHVHGTYADGVAPTLAVQYDLAVDTDESDARLLTFHEYIRDSDSLRQLGPAGAHLAGRIRRLASGG